MTTYQFIMVAWAVLFAALGWVAFTQQSRSKNPKSTTIAKDRVQPRTKVTH